MSDSLSSSSMKVRRQAHPPRLPWWAYLLGSLMFLVPAWAFFWPRFVAYIVLPTVPEQGEFTDVFYIHSDGTATDILTGLTWQLSPTKREYGWRTVSVPPGDMCFGNHCDWRVPTTDELRQLHEHIMQAKDVWTDEVCSGDSRLAHLCCSGSWLCFTARDDDNVIEASVLPFSEMGPFVADRVRNWTDACDPLYSRCYREHWELSRVNLLNGEIMTVELISVVTDQYVSGKYSGQWLWLLVR